MQDLAAKRKELEARLQKLQQEQEAAQKEFELMQSGGEKAQEALSVLEILLAETPDSMKPALFKSLYKALEQEAKRNGINLLAEATVSSNGKAPSTESNGKVTRKTTDDISEPSEFAVFKRNNRLAVDGVIDDFKVKFTKVYIGIDALRASGVSESNAKVWKEYLKGLGKTQIKVGNFFKNPNFPQLEGNYMIEVSGVTTAELARLIDIDFGLSPTNEENVERMSRELPMPNLVEWTPNEDESTEQPESEPIEEVEQVEEIREAEPVEVVTDIPKAFWAVGTKFQLVGVSGFDGNYGEVTAVNPDKLTPYVCTVDGFSIPLELRHNQLDVIPEADLQITDSELYGNDEDEATEEELELKDIPF